MVATRRVLFLFALPLPRTDEPSPRSLQRAFPERAAVEGACGSMAAGRGVTHGMQGWWRASCRQSARGERWCAPGERPARLGARTALVIALPAPARRLPGGGVPQPVGPAGRLLAGGLRGRSSCFRGPAALAQASFSFAVCSVALLPSFRALPQAAAGRRSLRMTLAIAAVRAPTHKGESSEFVLLAAEMLLRLCFSFAGAGRRLLPCGLLEQLVYCNEFYLSPPPTSAASASSRPLALAAVCSDCCISQAGR